MVLGAMYRRKTPSDEGINSVISGPIRALELAFQEAELRGAEMYRRGMLPVRPSLIDHGPVRILVSPTPTPDQIDSYVNTLTYYNVKHVVRVCEPTYDANILRGFGFAVHEWPFPDGDAPPELIVQNWLALLDKVFHYRSQEKVTTKMSSFSSDTGSESELSPSSSSDKPKETVAVHCIAGLGRAPVLAAVALVELGLDPYEAVGWLRALRRGAINARQMAYVESYARRPPPVEKPTRNRPRSGSFVGAFWPSLKAARPFRPRSPSQQREGSNRTSPANSRRLSPILHNAARV